MPNGGSVFRFGPFELDAPRGRLFHGTTRVPLSETHAAILLHLLSHVGEVVPKTALAETAWRDAAVTSNSVDQAISRLRKTLSTGQERTDYIETVPNRGYRFVGTIEHAQRCNADTSLDGQLDTFRVFVRGEADLNTLDRDAIVRARRAFEDVLRADPNYAPAHVGLASACSLAFESTRIDIAPDVAALKIGIEHARIGCDLAPASPEAWSTYAFALCLNGDNLDAVAAARKATDLDPLDWRHALRLSYVSWGEARLRAARRVLTLCPGMALAYWLMGTVFIARQAFDTALDLLCEGRAAQDAQPKSTAGFPAVGLHLLTALALAAVGKVEEAIESLTRELESPHRGQLYARECISNTWYTLGALRHRHGKRDAAAAAFTQALTVVPGHPCAAAALGISAEHTKRASLTRRAPRDPNTPQDPNTIDAAIVQAIGLVRAGRHPDAARVCADALNHAPAGLAGWLLPAEPMLNPTGRHEIWADTLRILSNRAV